MEGSEDSGRNGRRMVVWPVTSRAVGSDFRGLDIPPVGSQLPVLSGFRAVVREPILSAAAMI